MKNTLMVLAYQRPDSLKKCLKSISNIVNIENWEIVVSLDGGYDPKNIDVIYSGEFYPHTNIKHIEQSKNIKTSRHYIAAMDYCYTQSDIVIYTVEDCILTPDVCDIVDSFYDENYYKSYDTILLRDYCYTTFNELDKGKYTCTKNDAPNLLYSIPKSVYLETRTPFLSYLDKMCKDFTNLELFKNRPILRSVLPRGKHIATGMNVNESMQENLYDLQWYDASFYYKTIDSINIEDIKE